MRRPLQLLILALLAGSLAGCAGWTQAQRDPGGCAMLFSPYGDSTQEEREAWMPRRHHERDEDEKEPPIIEGGEMSEEERREIAELRERDRDRDDDD